MKNIQDWFAEYSESHQNQSNKVIHYICVPLIFASIIGLLWSIPAQFISGIFPYPISKFVNFATPVILLGLIFYLRLSFSIFVGMLVFCCLISVGCVMVEKSGIPLWLVSGIIFVLAWTGQFYGHKVEGKKPSFLKDIQFLLIGPAWVLVGLYRKFNIKY